MVSGRGGKELKMSEHRQLSNKNPLPLIYIRPLFIAGKHCIVIGLAVLADLLLARCCISM